MLLARSYRNKIRAKKEAKPRIMTRPAILVGAMMVACGARLVDASPSDNIATSKARQDKMRDMGGAFKAINDELKKGNPD